VPGLEVAEEGPVLVVGFDARRIGAHQPRALESLPKGAERLVTLDLKDVPLRRALRILFAESGVRHTVPPELIDSPVDLKVDGIPLITAFRLIVRQAASQNPGVTFTVEPGRFRLLIRPEAVEYPPLVSWFDGEQRKYWLELRDTPLRQALVRLFDGSGLQYAVDPNVPDVRITVRARNVTLPAALRRIIREAAKQVPGLTQSKG
jgi:hypothetical protein